MKENEEKKSDVIEIPVGKYLGSVRNNPWILSTAVLGVVLLIVLFMNFSGGVTGNVVSEESAGSNLISFINAQGTGEATLVSSEKEGALYKVTVNYDGQEIPVYVTLDGKYLVADPVPLSDSPGNDNTGNTDSNARVDVDVEGEPAKGEANAPVVMVEFSDYQCPFCSRHYEQSFKQIDTNYIKTGKLRYVMMDFPLDFHPEAQKAAESAHCVRDQKGDEGYFKMHDKLFTNQATLSLENYKKWARELGVNGAQFDTCLTSGKFESKVKESLAYGQQLGISGTPGFFINGKQVSGALPYSEFQKIIDAELAAGTA